ARDRSRGTWAGARPAAGLHRPPRGAGRAERSRLDHRSRTSRSPRPDVPDRLSPRLHRPRLADHHEPERLGDPGGQSRRWTRAAALARLAAWASWRSTWVNGGAAMRFG